MFRGDDTVGRFVTALENSSQFRDAMQNDDTAIGFALAMVGIDLPDPYQGNLIAALGAIRDSPNGWLFNDNLRKALNMEDKGGVAG